MKFTKEELRCPECGEGQIEVTYQTVTAIDHIYSFNNGVLVKEPEEVSYEREGAPQRLTCDSCDWVCFEGNLTWQHPECEERLRRIMDYAKEV